METALVTGTSSGIGLAASVHLARSGYQVFAGMRNTAKRAALSEAAGELPITVVEMDVTSEASTARAFERARQHGPIDVLVNNAGIGGSSPLELTPEAEHRAIFETNYFGAIRCIQAVLPEMRERGSGTIVNVSSIDGMSAKNALVAYAGSKWALRGMTRVAALELGKFGIRVNVVCPEAGSGDMLSPFMPEGVDPEVAAKFSQRILSTQMQRSIADKLDDIAHMILFLASDESASCTGTDFLVDGGYLAGFRFKQTPGG